MRKVSVGLGAEFMEIIRQELRRTYTEFGVPLPLTLGAPGKAILACLPIARQRWWLSQTINPPTPHTIGDAEVLRAELVTIRERGWARSTEERTPGISTVASAVFDHTGEVVGAVSVSVPVVRIDDNRADFLGSLVTAAGWKISEQLGASSDGVAELLRRASEVGSSAAETGGSAFNSASG